MIVKDKDLTLFTLSVLKMGDILRREGIPG
jgi:hypothetical protein